MKNLYYLIIQVKNLKIMKNLYLTLVAFTFVFSSCATPPAGGFMKFYHAYHDTPNTISFKIPGGLANLFVGNEDPAAKEFMKNIDVIRFFIADNADRDMLIDLNRYLPEELYKEMMEVHDGGSEIVFLARDNGKVISEIVMTILDGNQLVAMCMEGDFTQDDAKKLIKSINTKKAANMRG